MNPTESSRRPHRSGGGSRRRYSNNNSRSRGPRRGGDSREFRPQSSHRSESKSRGLWGSITSFFKKLMGGSSKKKSSSTRNGAPSSAGGAMPSTASNPVAEETRPEVLTPRLYIGNLSYDTSESDLFDLFQQIGAVKNVEVVRDRGSNSKGFGFVEMESLETAKAAAEKFHRTDFMGRQIVVSGAKAN